MNALDTSVAVPALLTDHVDHLDLRAAGGRDRVLPAHAALETFSVLTRLNAGRVEPGVAASLIAAGFASVIPLPAPAQRDLVSRLAEAGIRGGAVYDAVVALTALHHRARLFTRDRRAAAVYAALDVPVEWCA